MKKNILMIVMSMLFTVFTTLTAQKKIYIMTDLEGVSGVYKFAQTREKDTPLNIQACEYFMQDLAAVVRGLSDGGATEILIIDGHGSQAIIPHMMEPGAMYVTGIPRPGHLWGIDSTYVGMVQFGAHAMMGTVDGILCHTQSSKTENRYWYNGVESGELAQCAAIAGYYGVPTILVTGDVATCREATNFFGSECVTVAVKKGLARESALLYPFEQSHKALYEGAKKAMSQISKCKPYILKTPITAKIEYLVINPSYTKPNLVTKEWTIPTAIQLLDQ